MVARGHLLATNTHIGTSKTVCNSQDTCITTHTCTFLSLSRVSASSLLVLANEVLVLWRVEVRTSQGNPLVKRGVALHSQLTTDPASTTLIRSSLSITRPCSCVCVCVCVGVYLRVLGIKLCGGVPACSWCKTVWGCVCVCVCVGGVWGCTCVFLV